MLFIFSCFNGTGQEITLKSRSEKIKINDDSSFNTEVTIRFKESNEIRQYPIFFDSKLEHISNIQMYVLKGKRLKEIPIKKIFEEDVVFDYITSKKIKSIVIPADKEIELKYNVSCNELMYFSSLQFFSYNKIDTLKYQVHLPEKFNFVHDIIHKENLPFYKIDSSKTSNGSSVWKIKVAPMKVEPDPFQFFRIYKNIKAPLMRTLIVPETYKNKPTNYLNDWYYKSIISKKGLNDDAKRKIDQLTNNITDENKIIKVIYNYVRSNFKYVAIEIGMGAFIPSHVNEVFLNKQGDCKDLSNFLSEALKYKGIKSDIALAATFDHISDCDSPSLSSANHVICIAYLNNKKILLDPTDPIHLEGTPVQSLQNRTILIINSSGGSFFKIKPFTPEQNEISYQMELTTLTKEMLIKGSFEIKYKGISDNFLQRNLNYENKNKFNHFVKNYYQEIFGEQTITNITTTNKLNKLSFNGNILINGKTFNDGQSKYLFIDFLPRLIETESRETLLEGTYLNNPFYKKVRVKIKLDEPIDSFKTKKHLFDEKDTSLEITIKYISNLEIECNYDFKFNHIFIDNKNIEKINETLKSFKKIINEPIILQKQKT